VLLPTSLGCLCCWERASATKTSRAKPRNKKEAGRSARRVSCGTSGTQPALAIGAGIISLDRTAGARPGLWTVDPTVPVPLAAIMHDVAHFLPAH
jgi:hypothetical protein